MQRYDCAIVGGGPAGLEAAITLKVREKRFVLFAGQGQLRKVESAPRIDNYLGLPVISGMELARRFREHLAEMEITPLAEQVSMVYPMGDYFSLATARNTYEARAVILALGTAPARSLPGEERLLGHGVSYCATCDAPLCRGKRVAVAGWSAEAPAEANFLAELAAKVYYLPMRGAGTALRGDVELLHERPLELLGTNRLEGLKTTERVLAVDTVFLLRESIAPAALVPGLGVSGGYITVDARMATTLPGCFAAGDCTGKPHQYIRAAGQGLTAALSAVAWLDESGK